MQIRRDSMSSVNDNVEKNEGVLSVSVNSQGQDNYDFKRRAALVRQLKTELGLGELEPLPSPWTLEIEPTLYCNARCHFCSYEKDIEKFKKSRVKRGDKFGLSKNVVIKTLETIKDAATTKGTYWSGGGEPLVWPHFSEAVKYAATFSDVFVQTNGICLNRYLNSPEGLLVFRLISVSVFANTAEMHQRIGGTKSFERIIKNIRDTIAMKRKYGLDITLNVKIMVDTVNYPLLPAIVKFYEDLGVDSIGLRLVQDYNYGGVGPRKISVELSREQKAELFKIIESSDYQHPSLKVFAQTLIGKKAKTIITKHCYNAIDGHFACIDAWGNVHIGNPEIGDDKFRIGNINQTPWEEIWKSETHSKVIRLMDEMEQKGVCASELCRHVKANIGAQEYATGMLGRQDRETVMKAFGAFL